MAFPAEMNYQVDLLTNRHLAPDDSHNRQSILQMVVGSEVVDGDCNGFKEPCKEA